MFWVTVLSDAQTVDRVACAVPGIVNDLLHGFVPALVTTMSAPGAPDSVGVESEVLEPEVIHLADRSIRGFHHLGVRGSEGKQVQHHETTKPVLLSELNGFLDRLVVQLVIGGARVESDD